MAGCLCTLAVALSCTEPLEPGQLDAYDAQVPNLTARYLPASDRIQLGWTAPLDQEVTYYELYRWLGINRDGDTLELTTRRVGAAATEFRDVPDLPKSTYYYAIAPVRVAEGTAVRGRASPPAEVVAGLGVSFTIDDGARATKDPDVELKITDANGRVARVRFTQIFDSTSGEPRFGEDSRGNPTGFHPIDGAGEHTFPWKLNLGRQDKIVYAEITLDATNGNRVDTLRYGMPIAPYQARIRIENERLEWTQEDELERYEGELDATVLYRHIGNQGFTLQDHFVFFVPRVEFSLEISVDSSFAPRFEYWLLFANRAASNWDQGDRASSREELQWLETGHRVDSLTGIGPYHDDKHVYTYSIDTLTPEGRQNLSTVQVIHNTTDYPFVTYDETLQGGAGDKLRRVLNLTPKDRANTGAKEFVLVIKLQGRYFGEERYILSKTGIYDVGNEAQSGAVKAKEERYLWFDFIPPKATMVSPTNAGYLNNGDTISTAFDYALDGASVVDGGYGRVTDIKLVFARCPSSLEAIWDYTSWSIDEAVPITLADLYEQRVATYEYEISSPLRNMNDVEWKNIDPSTWPSGKYFMGIVTRDEHGNEGLAPVTRSLAPNYQTNPFLVTVTSGRGSH